MKKILYFLAFFLIQSSLKGQVLTLNEAIETSLQNNFDIKTSKNALEIARTNNFVGNSGKLPRVAINIGDTYQFFGLNQKLSNGTETNRDGVTSNNLNANIRADWTLFNGFRISAIQQRLKLLEKAGDYALKAQIQQTTANIVVRYYDVVRQKQLLKVLEKTTLVSEQRLSLIKTRQEVGTANNTDLYLAQLDIATQKDAVSNQKLFIEQAKIDLNILLGRASDTKYDTEEDITVANLSEDELKNTLQNNTQLQIAQNNLSISKQIEQETKAQKMPIFNVNAGYGYLRNNSTAGLQLLNQTYGPFVGFNLTVPLYNANVNEKQLQVARLQTSAQQINIDRIQSQLSGEFDKQWQAYQISKSQLAVEEESVKTARNYLDLMQKRFELGQSNTIDIREAQRSFETTENRRIQTLFAVKAAEVQLLLLTNTIVK